MLIYWLPYMVQFSSAYQTCIRILVVLTLIMEGTSVYSHLFMRLYLHLYDCVYSRYTVYFYCIEYLFLSFYTGPCWPLTRVMAMLILTIVKLYSDLFSYSHVSSDAYFMDPPISYITIIRHSFITYVHMLALLCLFQLDVHVFLIKLYNNLNL